MEILKEKYAYIFEDIEGFILDNNLKPIFSGIQKFSTLDDPGNVAITVFAGGCNFKCRYCHNSDFICDVSKKRLDVVELINFFVSRIGLIDTIVFCGGEPTIHNKNLLSWLKFAKSLGFRIKLDTNATNFNIIENIIENKLVDIFSIDYKSSIKSYDNVIGRELTEIEIMSINNSIKKIIENDIELDIRTTLHSDIHSYDDLYNMASELLDLGVERYTLQGYVDSSNVYDKTLGFDNSDEYLDRFKLDFKDKFKQLEFRNYY